MRQQWIAGWAVVFALCSSAPLSAKVPPEEAAKLGDTLTPVGAETVSYTHLTLPTIYSV